MATYRCIVVTTRVESDGRRDMRIALDHPDVEWSDISEQTEDQLPADPPVVVAEGIRASESSMTAIQADSNAVVLVCEEENG